MYIKKISIDGYRTLYDFELYDLNKKVNVFIGENNVGKSNILKALDIFFNKDKINENDKTIILDYTMIQKNTKRKEELIISIEFSQTIPLTRVASINTSKEKTIIAKFNKDNAKQMMYYYSDSEIRHVPSDKMNLIPSYIYIGDLNDKKFNIENLFQVFSQISEDKISEVETYANNFLSQIYEGLEGRIAVSIKNISDNIIIKVMDDFGNTNMFEEKSSGIQQMSFMALFLGLTLVSLDNKIIIALEEPEANLHLKLQKQLFILLKMIAQTTQVFISTHSAVFIDRINTKGIFHITRNNKGKTKISSGLQQGNWYELRRDLGLSVSDSLLFAPKNLIVEGITEKILLPFLIDKLSETKLIKFTSDDVNIISSEGASNASYFLKLISELDLQSFVLLDNDPAGDKAEKDIISKMPKFKNHIIRLSKEGNKQVEFEDLFDDNIISKALSEVYKKDISTIDVQDARTSSGYMKFTNMVKELESKKELEVKFDDIGKHKFARTLRYYLEKDLDNSLSETLINMFKEIEKILID